ncbi:glycosyltransferase family 2 protein [Patescibacteria group bacterium]|nr:glycosyltransferase family 2 protein [Patescibacteria group bacterium]
MKIDVSIIVVTYNEDADLLKNCFDSVNASNGVDFELIISDNGNNKSTKELARKYKNTKYINNVNNLGFSKAVNVGMKIASGRYILLLNPDASFGSNVLQKMVAHLDEDTGVGIASCIIEYPNGKLQESIRRFPTPFNQMQILLKIPHIFQTKAFKKYMMCDANPCKTQDVDSIMGAFMWIRSDLIGDIGLLDERYWIWFEEVDYCKMASESGWKIRHYADVKITHHKGHAFGKILTLKKQKWIRTSLRKYIKKHFGIIWWVIFWIFTPVFVVLALIASVIKPR